MRSFGCSMIGLLMLTASSFAQGPPPAAKDPLDGVLGGWEKAMTDLRSFVVVVDRTTIDKSLQTKDDYKGFALFAKATAKDSGSKARIQLEKTTNKNIFEKYICT